MRYFQRKLQKEIQPWLKKPDVIVIFGARQVGKTSLLSLLKDDIEELWGDSKNIFTFNLEKSDHLTALNRDPRYFKEYLIFSGADPKKESVVMIDEIQYLDDPSHFLKYHTDLEPSIKLIVTGSTSIKVRKFKDGLTGRKKSFHLFGLDFCEFVLFKKKERFIPVLEGFNFKEVILNRTGIDPQRILPFRNELQTLFEEYILYGGYPRVVLAESYDEKLRELQELFETYELKDVNILFNVGNIAAFRNLFRLMAANIGSLLNINEVAGILGIGRDTVKRYLAVLENSFITHSLPPFHGNVRKELTKMPKLFFLDTGMRNFALKNFTQLSFRPDRGCLFENAIFCELYKNLGIIDQIFFWRTLSKNEVDFILTGDQKLAIESKLFFDSQLKRPAGLRAFGNLYPDFKYIVATMNQFAFSGGIYYLPGWMI